MSDPTAIQVARDGRHDLIRVQLSDHASCGLRLLPSPRIEWVLDRHSDNSRLDRLDEAEVTRLVVRYAVAFHGFETRRSLCHAPGLAQAASELATTFGVTDDECEYHGVGIARQLAVQAFASALHALPPIALRGSDTELDSALVVAIEQVISVAGADLLSKAWLKDALDLLRQTRDGLDDGPWIDFYATQQADAQRLLDVRGPAPAEHRDVGEIEVDTSQPNAAGLTTGSGRLSVFNGEILVKATLAYDVREAYKQLLEEWRANAAPTEGRVEQSVHDASTLLRSYARLLLYCDVAGRTSDDKSGEHIVTFAAIEANLKQKSRVEPTPRDLQVSLMVPDELVLPVAVDRNDQGVPDRYQLRLPTAPGSTIAPPVELVVRPRHPYRDPGGPDLAALDILTRQLAPTPQAPPQGPEADEAFATLLWLYVRPRAGRSLKSNGPGKLSTARATTLLKGVDPTGRYEGPARDLLAAAGANDAAELASVLLELESRVAGHTNYLLSNGDVGDDAELRAAVAGIEGLRRVRGDTVPAVSAPEGGEVAGDDDVEQ